MIIHLQLTLYPSSAQPHRAGASPLHSLCSARLVINKAQLLPPHSLCPPLHSILSVPPLRRPQVVGAGRDQTAQSGKRRTAEVPRVETLSGTPAEHVPSAGKREQRFAGFFVIHSLSSKCPGRRCVLGASQKGV